MSNFAKYVALAKKLGMIDARMISPGDIFFDVRAILKCRWGCEDFLENDIRCDTRGTSYRQRIDMVNAYDNILIVHCHDARELSKAALEIERTAFLDGFYFAFAVRRCHLCQVCAVTQGKACPSPERVRPCDQGFGIDMYKTARNLGMPCEVLQSENDVRDWYGLVLID